MTLVCSLPRDSVDGEPPLKCGRTAIVVFTEKKKIMGKWRNIRYPRCKQHGSERTIAWAEDHGYKVAYIKKGDS